MQRLKNAITAMHSTEAQKAYKRQWYLDNKAVVQARTKKWREDNPEKVTAQNKRGYLKNREKIILRSKQQYEEDPEHCKNITRRWRKEHPEAVAKYSKNWIKNNPIKREAHRLLSSARLTGKLTRPDTCSLCDKECIPHGHHDDYGKPLEVRWLCAKCHRQYHLENK